MFQEDILGKRKKERPKDRRGNVDKETNVKRTEGAR